MNKTHKNMIHIALNAVTLTIFSWLQIMIFSITADSFHGGTLFSLYIVSFLCVPLFWWGLFPKVK